jgi:hypothetical protein
MPKLTSWLRLVFTVLGGYIVGAGIVDISPGSGHSPAIITSLPVRTIW